MRDRGNGLKTQPVVYHWTSGAGWMNPTSYEVVRMKAVNHKPMIRLGGTPRPLGQGGGQPGILLPFSFIDFITKKGVNGAESIVLSVGIKFFI